MTRQLYRATAVVGGMTLISRLMGFVRDVLIANLFGVDAATDAFFVAFKIPNFLRRLFAEGSFAQAFVPLLVEHDRQVDRQGLREFIARVAGTLAVLLFLVTTLAIILAPVLISVFAPGFYWEDGQFAMAVTMLRITMPYVLFITLTAFAGAILNALGKFAVPAVTPVFLNLCLVVAATCWAPLFEQPILALAWGVLVAGVVQLAFQLPALLKLGLISRPRWGWQDAKVRQVFKLMTPSVFAVSVVQINLLFDTLVASFLPSGSISWLYYSDRLVEFPLGILGVAVATVVLPQLARHHAVNDGRAFSQSLHWGVRLVWLIGLPATLGLVLLAQPMVSSLFEYNHFGAGDTKMASHSLMAFASGLLAFMLIKLLVSGFSAQNDNQLPVRYGLYSVISNVIMNLVLVGPLDHAGVALATTLAAYLNVLLLVFSLLRRNTLHFSGKGMWFALRVILAVALMSGFLITQVDGDGWALLSASQRFRQLGLVIVEAIAVYLSALMLLGIGKKDLTLGV